ncbi:MAG: N-acetylneuraminate synthase family protein, partial [Candidatus Asgardarchaeia archaeon]
AKFQTWKVERLRKGPWDEDGRRKIYEKAELTEKKHQIVKDFCDQIGIKFLTSCFCVDDIDLIKKFTNEIKIPSPEAYDYELMRKSVDEFEEVYLSTGASYPDEYLKWAEYSNVTLLHCVSSYPCDYDSIKFNKFRFLQTLTDRVGYSGHLSGVYDAIVAICYGATVIEKHFTIDHGLPGRDNKFALLPNEFAEIREFLNIYERMNEERGLEIQECEKDYRKYQKGRWG